MSVMKCATHPDVDATAYCRNCGKALCPACTHSVQGMFYCEPCLAALVAHPTAAAPPAKQHLPVAAFFLGLIPGLGAVYNGEYTKALVHVGIFVGLVTVDSSGMHQPLFGLLTAFFCLYMPVEACVTATNLHHAEAQAAAAPRATTFSPPQPAAPTGLVAFAPSAEPVPTTGVPAAGVPPTPPQSVPPQEPRRPRLLGPVILIVIGVIFLADNLGWMDADRVLSHGWPLILIALGIFLIWKKTTGAR